MPMQLNVGHLHDKSFQQLDRLVREASVHLLSQREGPEQYEE